MAVAGGASPFAIERRAHALHLSGDLRLASAAELWRELHADVGDPHDQLDIDLADVRTIDGAAVALLVDLQERLAHRGVRSHFVGASPRVAALVALHQGYRPPPPRRRAFGFVEHVGEDVRKAWSDFRIMVEFVGDAATGALASFVRPLAGERKSVVPLIVRAGTDAIPLVVVLNLLLGFVIAYDTASELVKYGAELYVADVVGVAVTRELSPILTSVIVLGRSAASYAAELGSMKVSEELDAMKTLGLVPARHLVLPRMLALLAVAPLLTLIGDVAGVTGGALIAIAKLGVSARAFITELRSIVDLGDVLGGLLKAGLTGLAIAVIGAQQGFAATGGPVGVGIRTTSTVVKSLVALVVIDVFFAVVLERIRS